MTGNLKNFTKIFRTKQVNPSETTRAENEEAFFFREKHTRQRREKAHVFSFSPRTRKPTRTLEEALRDQRACNFMLTPQIHSHLAFR